MKQAGPSPPVLAKARAADSGKPVPARTTAARARPRPERRQLAPAPSATYLRQRSPQGPDEELARRLRVLINVFAPAFGLDPSRVHLTLSSTTQSGARSGDAITISGAVDPASIQTRQLVAHELVHARQHSNRRRSPSPKPSVSAAESEAAGLAAAVLEGRRLWIPRQALPDGHMARGSGGVGIAPETTSPTETATTSDVASLEHQLDQLVAVNHSGDQRFVAGQLDHPWTQTHDGMVENCLFALSTMPFVVARAVVRSLKPEVRLRLAALHDGHHEKYPDTSIAVLSALTKEEFAKLRNQVVGEQPYRGATVALHGVDPDRLSKTARRSLMAALRRQSVSTLEELEKGNRGAVFHGLLRSGVDFGTDEDELRAAIAQESERFSDKATGADAFVQKMQRVLAHPNVATAKTALSMLSAPLGAASPGATGTPGDQPAVALPPREVTLEDLRGAIKPHTAGSPGTNAPLSVPAAAVALVAKLDGESLVDKILDALPEADRYGDTYREVVKKMLAARDPALNLSRATSLLSYGLLDWLISDAEARYAYLLVRSCSIDAQDRWRALDDGKWLHRLEDNLPDDMISSSEYTGVGSEYKPDNGMDLGIPEKLLKGYAEQKFLARWEKDSSEAVAKEIVQELIGINPDRTPKPWLADPKSKMHDTALRTAIVRRIDARLKLDDIIQGLPNAYLYGDDGRADVVALNAMRDPVHLIEQARNLVPSGFFEWLFFGWITFTVRKAWIAALALSGLSPEDHERLAREDPDLVNAVADALTPDMAQKLPTPLAAGRDARFPTRQALEDRLSDERLWSAKMAAVLRSLIDQAYAAEDRKWVFDKSKELRADKRPGLEEIVKDFHLYSEKDGRTDWLPELTKQGWLPVLGRKLGVIGRALGLLVYDVLIGGSIDLWGRTMHLKAFDLGQGQMMYDAIGSELKGVKLAETKGGVNEINVDATFESGFIVNVDLKDLEIAGVNIALSGKSYRSGPISVKGLKATAGFSDRHYNDPAYIGVTLGSLAVRDLVLVDPSLPFSGAWAIALLALQTLKFRASQDESLDPVSKIGQKLPKGMSSIPIPVFGPLFQLLSNIVAIKGGIPGDITLLDLALYPLHLPFPTSTVADYVFPTPAPLTYAWGLASDGVLRPPYSAAQRIKDSIGTLRAFSVSFTELKIEGISIGAGQQIQSLTLTDVNLGVGQSLPAYLNTAVATLKRAQAKLDKNSQQYKDLDARIAVLQLQIAAVEASPHLTELRRKRAHEPRKLTDTDKKELALADEKSEDEGRLAELEAKDRWNPGSLTKAERAQLVELSHKLRSDVGITAEIGSITLGPLTGTVQAAGVSLEGIHASLQVPNVGLLPLVSSMAYLDDKSLAQQFIDGGPRIPTIGELAKSAKFSLAVDRTTLLSTDPKQPAVIIKPSGIPSSKDLKDLLDGLPVIPGNEPIRNRLKAAYDTVSNLEQQQNLADTSIDIATRAAAQQKVLELKDDAARLLGTEIGGIKLGRITGELDAKGGLAVTIHGVEITKLAGPGFAVEKLTGDISAGLEAGGISVRPDQVKAAALAAQVEPTFGLKNVEATGISLAKGSIKRAKIGMLHGSVHATKTGFEFPKLTIDHLDIDGVEIGKDGDGLKAEVVSVRDLALHAEIVLDKTPGGTKLSRAIIHSLEIDELAGAHIVYDAPQEKGGSLRLEMIDGSIHGIKASEVVIDPGSEGFGLVSGSAEIGSFADLRYSVAIASLKSRTTVKGTLTKSKEAKGPTVKASYARDQKHKFSLAIQDLEALGTDISTPDGRVVIRKVKVGATLDGDDEVGIKAAATLSDLTVGPIDWTVGKGHLSGTGPIVAKTVTVAAVRTPAVPAKDKQPAKPAAWSITDIFITGLEGSGLSYKDPPIEMHLGRDDKPAVPGERPLKVGRIHLQPAAKKIEVDDLSVDFSGSLKSELNISGSGHLEFKSFTMDLDRDGHIVATVRGAEAQATVSGDYSGSVEVKGLKGATVDIGPDAVRIGGIDPDDPSGLHVDQLSFTALDVSSVISGHKFRLKSQIGGRVDFFGVEAKVRLDRWKPGEKHDPKSAFRQMAIEHLHVDAIDLDAMQIDMPSDDLTIIIPARTDSDPPTFHGLDLYGSTDEKGKSLHPEFIVDLKTMAFEGGVSLLDITLPASVALKNKFKGDVKLTTQKSTIDFLVGGGLKIDIANPRLTMDRAAELGTDAKIRVAKLGADRLTVADSRVHLQNVLLEDLEYRQTVAFTEAIKLQVKSATIPDLTYKIPDGGDLTIPKLDINEAHFELDLWTLMQEEKKRKEEEDAASPKPVKVPPAFEIEGLHPVADSVDGKIKLVMFITKDIHGLKDIRIGSPSNPLEIHIDHGAIDFATLEKNLYGKVSATHIDPGWALRPWVVEHVAKDPILRLRGDELELGVYKVDPVGYRKTHRDEADWTWEPFVTWKLEAPDLTKAQANQLALYAAIFEQKPDEKKPPPKDDEEKKKREDEAAKATDAKNSIELRNIDANLSVNNTDPIEIKIKGSLAAGTIVLGPNAIKRLHVTGGLPPIVAQPMREAGAQPKELDVELDAVNVDKVALEIGSHQLDTGKITIDGLANASVGFADLKTPTKLSGTITEAHAYNIHWYRRSKK